MLLFLRCCLVSVNAPGSTGLLLMREGEREREGGGESGRERAGLCGGSGVGVGGVCGSRRRDSAVSWQLHQCISHRPRCLHGQCLPPPRPLDNSNRHEPVGILSRTFTLAKLYAPETVRSASSKHRNPVTRIVNGKWR